MSKETSPDPPPESPNVGDQPIVDAPPPGMFGDQPAKMRDCLVLIYDFENFTGFLSIPDIHRAVAGYLNLVDGHIRQLFTGGNLPGYDRTTKPLDLKLLHEKFVGDGMMFIMEVNPLEVETVRNSNIRALCRRIVVLKNHFDKINAEAMNFMPVADLPQRIRFGLTYGTLLELPRAEGGSEYVGFAINLAARLQKYSGKASFLASARLPHADKWMSEYNFVKVKATELRGRPNEFVYIDRTDLEAIKETPESSLFEVVQGAPTKPAGETRASRSSKK